MSNNNSLRTFWVEEDYVDVVEGNYRSGEYIGGSNHG